MSNYLEIAERNQKKARQIIRDLDIVGIWQSVGAEVNLVGSLKMGLLMKHLDIDLHIYTDVLDIRTSFDVVSKLAQHSSIKKIEYKNLIDTDERCIEWHTWFQDNEQDEIWQIDMIHILRRSKYAGYFEKVAQRIVEVLTPQTKETILKLKYQTPDTVKMIGIEYYQAVIEDGITDYESLVRWKEQRPDAGIIGWMP